MATKPEDLALTEAALNRRAETTRVRIKTAALIDKLQNHVMGKDDMTPTQLAAAQTLLKKVLPDMVSARQELNVSPVVFQISTTPKK
jgi:hypothetical protein